MRFGPPTWTIVPHALAWGDSISENWSTFLRGGDHDARDIFLCREELDRLGRRHGRDVAGLEAEHPHPCYELALELRVVELARDDLAGRHLAGGSDGDFQDDLPLQRRLVTQRPAVQDRKSV